MYDVAILGFGRVGLPLGLSLEECGLSVAAIDIDDSLIEKFANHIMPFKEPGYEESIKNTKIKIYNPNRVAIPEAKAYVITVGTPLEKHIEVSLDQVNNAIDDLLDMVDIKNKLIVLRSTVAPYTSESICNRIESKTGYLVSEDFYFVMAPERIVEGEAKKELRTLPQVIGAEDDESYNRAVALFGGLGSKMIRASFIQAELSKLFSNIYRYINFAIPNYFTYLANEFNVDVFDLFKIMNTGYDRNNGLKMPGFCSGTCLRKDFGQINECFPATDLLLQAYKINEFMPKYYVDRASAYIDQEVTVGILGYTMKKDCDDTRDSLVPKMIRYIQRLNPKEVLINEPNLPEIVNDSQNNFSFNNRSIEDVLNCDVIFIAINHSQYYTISPDRFSGQLVIDVWGILNENVENYF